MLHDIVEHVGLDGSLGFATLNLPWRLKDGPAERSIPDLNFCPARPKVYSPAQELAQSDSGRAPLTSSDILVTIVLASPIAKLEDYAVGKSSSSKDNACTKSRIL